MERSKVEQSLVNQIYDKETASYKPKESIDTRLLVTGLCAFAAGVFDNMGYGYTKGGGVSALGAIAGFLAAQVPFVLYELIGHGKISDDTKLFFTFGIYGLSYLLPKTTSQKKI